jgi:predicted enzyme related to lactoylglutathione lyase
MSNALNWFEIPVTDLARAKSFYGSVLQADLREETMSGTRMVILPYEKEKGGVGGALVAGEGFVPGGQGVVVYLNAGDDLDGAISRVEAAGGKIVLGKTLISKDIGSIAQFLDTEGNRVALHSPR